MLGPTQINILLGMILLSDIVSIEIPECSNAIF